MEVPKVRTGQDAKTRMKCLASILALTLASSCARRPIACVVDDRGLYFVNRQGKTAPAFQFDNGPDYVVEGMARTVKNGKVGFVNTQLDRVVPPVWDFASPFEHGVAAVCTGCVSTPISPGDEHKKMTGGKWGYIRQTRKNSCARRL